MKKDLISLRDLNKKEIIFLFKKTKELKKLFQKKKVINLLKGRIGALLFEKPSLRTRVTFETALKQLGGDSIYLSPQDVQMGKRESVKDIAQNLSRWVDLIIVRTFSHNITKELKEYSTIPVINALDDYEHPCQALADYYTIWEREKNIEKIKLGFIGDGNNVCHSLMIGAKILEIDMMVATPNGYEPDKEIIEFSKGRVYITNDPKEVVKECDYIYTDVWVSMGQESEKEKRIRDFQGFQINSELLKLAKRDYKIMHCLPAHRGEEITDEVLDGKNSIVLDQAENRLHIQRSLILYLLNLIKLPSSIKK
ncbi:MAG: ornithine carbamoyltransferase [candidate division WOR-3 bacterium]|nr:ornithine carbamoyltransferase [candidate division WOR-3 bacterium]MCX7836840.1 ornithine carbamoyltransferase [candidate division WOR-3 bacterium]MDW8114291.1 ornithine carbamoyltransferase [candidate division WOR-3 bacterium]